MNLPPPPRNERRVVPRHFRDGEHTWEDQGTSTGNGAAGGGPRRLWLWSAGLLALLAAVVAYWLYRAA